MPTLIHPDGTVKAREVLVISYILILAALAYTAALAINDFAQAVLSKYVKKDSLFGYALYALLAVILVIVIIYFGCWLHPEVIHYLNISPVH